MPIPPRPPILWRIRGRAPDGLVVTLGRYETEPEAQADLSRFKREGRYRELDLQALPPPPPQTPV
ncbi:MAG: hypothetical protein U1D55_14415 [Phycisphaerae bacterium]